MDDVINPYAPGAGVKPPELAGRDDIIKRASTAMQRIRNQKHARSFVLYGLRGVGKTVLLNKIRTDAEALGMSAAIVEASEEKSLPATLLPHLRSLLYKISRGQAVKEKLGRAMRAASGFARALKIKYNDIEVSFDSENEKGLADSGDLEADLTDLLLVIGEAALENGTGVLISIDELQYIKETQLSALIMALHAISQKQYPVTMIAAGLPQLLGKMGNAKSYAERLFEFEHIDRLETEAAKEALCKPAHDEGVIFEEDAINEILAQTQAYPYFLQEWGKHSWNIAPGPKNITLSDAQKATSVALRELDKSFFRVRFDRLTPDEKQYALAMAELGPGPHMSKEIADKLRKTEKAVALNRASLIEKGMVYSPNQEDTSAAFTVPLFEGFLKRTMPPFAP